MQGVRSTAQIGPYRLGACVGRGGMGEVYEAEHVRLGRRRALKVMRPELFDNERIRLRFIKEITALARVEHPNVVDILDVGDDQGQVYYAMEFLEGMTLRDHANRLGGQMTWEQLHPILMQLSDALATAHRAGVIHRDLKPSNVMLVRREGRDEFVKIVDFGIAKIIELAGSELITGTSEFFGSLAYMSPEQAAQSAAVDARSDMYSLGSMIYELLSGSPPFVGVPVRVLTQLAREVPPDLLERCPELLPEVAQFVHRLLNKLPEDRFADMTELMTALRRLLPGSADSTGSANSVHASGTTSAVNSTPSKPAAAPDMDGPEPTSLQGTTLGLLLLTVVSVITLVFLLRNHEPEIDGSVTSEPGNPAMIPSGDPPAKQGVPSTTDLVVKQTEPGAPAEGLSPSGDTEPSELAAGPPVELQSTQSKAPSKGGAVKPKKTLCGNLEWMKFAATARGECGITWSFQLTAGVKDGKLIVELRNSTIESLGATLCVLKSFRDAHGKCDIAGLGSPRERAVQ